MDKDWENLPIKRRLFLHQEPNGIEVSSVDVGVGLSQVIPVVVAALYQKTGIVAIEQPELHIHPALQLTLGDLFISQIQDRNLMFLIETHSEHLMLRLQRRIRETHENELPPGAPALHPEQLAVHYVEPDDKGLQVNLYALHVDEEGDFIDRWPKGFFGERVKERF